MSKVKQTVTSLLILSILVAAFSGCRSSSVEDDVMQNYIATINSPIPQEVESATEIVVFNDTVYICVRKDSGNSRARSYIATMNLDGSDYQQLSEDLGDSYELRDFVITAGGDIWAVCEIEAESFCLLRFSDTGILEETISLSQVMEGIVVNSQTGLFISLDADENIYVTVKFGTAYVHVFNNQGQYQFSLEDSRNPLTAITTSEGDVAICDTNAGGLVSIDADRNTWSDNKVEITSVSGLYGGKTHSFYVFDAYDFYGYDIKTGSKKPIFRWSDMGLSTGDSHVYEYEDGKFAILAGAVSQSGLYSYELTILEQGEDERTVLTMTSISANPSIVQAVSDFNKTSTEYKVELTEYFPYEQNVSDEDWNDAITHLNTRLISGEIPDVIDMSSLPVEVYQRKGVLENLYTYIDNDVEIKLEDYFENVFSAISVDGELPYVTNGVIIQTMVSDGDVISNSKEWTFEGISSLLERYGGNSISNLTGESFLKIMLQVSDDLVDWDLGECYFDSPEFAQLLETAKSIHNAPVSNEDTHMVTYEAVLNVHTIAQLDAAYAGNMSIIGFPSNEELYNVISPETRIGISATSEHKEGAWSFVRSFLTKKNQETCMSVPILEESFNAVMHQAIEGNSIWTSMYDIKITPEDVTLLKDLLNSSTHIISANASLEKIVLSDALEYFSDNQTIEKTVVSIQNRATTYINEQG